MLWRSLRDAAPLSAVLTDCARAELIYPDRREIRAWPSFELLGTVPAGGPGPPGNAQAEGGLAAELGRALGGSVSAVTAGPSGRVAALWTAEPFPPWYHVVSYLQVRSRDDTGNGAHQWRPMLVADR